MTLAGAIKDEIINMAKSGFYQLLPNTDASGRAIIYARIGMRDYSRYSVRQELMWVIYLLEIVVQNKSLQSRGYVYLFDASNGTGLHYKRKTAQYMLRALDGAFPIRRCSIHICNASPLVSYVLYPVALRLTSKNVRLRTRLHRGSGDDLLRSLAEFNLPRDRVPSDLGGSVVLNIYQFLIDRFTFETSHAGIDLPAAEQPRSPEDAGIAGKRQKRSETDMVGQVDRRIPTDDTLSSAASYPSVQEQAPPINVSSAGAAAAAASFGTATRTCANGGRHLPLRHLPLYASSDEDYLSPLVCLMRSQIEIFTAAEDDIEARAVMGGVVQTISPGRVGLRCIHCRHLPTRGRANGAVSYPASTRVLNQSVRNWQRYHWGPCAFIPPSAREEFERLNSGKKTYSTHKSKNYWTRRSEEMGLVDAVAKNLEGEESEGIYFEADARTLGLHILVPAQEEEQTSGTARMKTNGTKKAGTSGKRKKVGPDDSNEEDIVNESPDDETDVASILLQFKRSA